MKINVYGAGYVGQVTAAMLAKRGHEVRCIDIDPVKISLLQSGVSTIFEPGLAELLPRVQFSLYPERANVHVICVGTPSLDDGSHDLRHVFSCVDKIKTVIQSGDLVVVKSTVPPGTTAKVQEHLHDYPTFFVPEFLREGCALSDSENPDRLVIGTGDILHRLGIIIGLFSAGEEPTLQVRWESAEFIKLGSNFALAAKISMINELSLLVDHYGGNIDEVAKGIGLDNRIGPQFLRAGLGFGGSCFPKDVRCLQSLARKSSRVSHMLDATIRTNEAMVDFAIDKISEEVGYLTGKRICVWGQTFKPHTDDVRESQAVSLCKRLTSLQAAVVVHDPQVANELTPIEAADGCQLVVIATEWPEYRQAAAQLPSSVPVIDLRRML